MTALCFRTAIDDPRRFRRSRDVAAYFGLTSKRWHSGTSIDVKGRISKAGDPEMRRALYEAATAMLGRYKGKDALKTWGEKLARCHAKAAVAMARKLAVIMHAMWRDGTDYDGGSALANKLARIAWAVLARGVLYEPGGVMPTCSLPKRRSMTSPRHVVCVWCEGRWPNS